MVRARGKSVLAAGADRDVSEVRSELRAHTSALNALRQTQVKMQRTMTQGFATMGAGMPQILRRLDDLTGREGCP